MPRTLVNKWRQRIQSRQKQRLKPTPLEQAKSHAREIAKAKRNELVASGITEEGADAAIKHIILSTEEHFEDVQADWKPSQWIEFGKTLKRLEVDPDETPEQQAKDEVEEAEPTTEAEPTPEPEVEELPEVEASEESEDSDNANQLELLLDEVDDITKKK